MLFLSSLNFVVGRSCQLPENLCSFIEFASMLFSNSHAFETLKVIFAELIASAGNPSARISRYLYVLSDTGGNRLVDGVKSSLSADKRTLLAPDFTFTSTLFTTISFSVLNASVWPAVTVSKKVLAWFAP